jgi:hypothetical protein
VRCLRDLHHRRSHLTKSAFDQGLLSSQAALPTTTQMLRLLARLFRRAMEARLEQRLNPERWCIGYRRQTGSSGDGASRMREFRQIPAPPGRFFADPFVLKHGDHHYIFFEDRRPGDPGARISFVALDSAGQPSPPRPALEGRGHFSYPFVFHEGDDIFMIPETAAREVVELYRAVRFPREWVLEKVLLRGIVAADATLLVHNDRFWLFAAVDLDGGKRFDELFLFSSDTLLGEWMPHPMNPIVSDVRSARPAGRILIHGDRLIRPSQDCSDAYGRRVVLNEIELVNETEYMETVVGYIEAWPGTSFSRTHSYNAEGEYEVVDAIERRMRFRWPRQGRHPLDIRLRCSLPDSRSPVANASPTASTTARRRA